MVDLCEDGNEPPPLQIIWNDGRKLNNPEKNPHESWFSPPQIRFYRRDSNLGPQSSIASAQPIDIYIKVSTTSFGCNISSRNANMDLLHFSLIADIKIQLYFNQAANSVTVGNAAIQQELQKLSQVIEHVTCRIAWRLCNPSRSSEHALCDCFVQGHGNRCDVYGQISTLVRLSYITHLPTLLLKGGPIVWPPRSPDLTPLDLFFWGYVKDKVYATPVRDLRDLRERIIEATENIPEDMLQRAWQEIVHRLDIVTVTTGAHVEIWYKFRLSQFPSTLPRYQVVRSIAPKSDERGEGRDVKSISKTFPLNDATLPRGAGHH
ncbi:hypothetical protein ANN_12550 [Periplaneta americana]|uniref:Uncharacterized protein n=1 Tax=Periplaneta americana TaxID=6978 RepID=A0ABQ8TJ52_PERAM|nr:hypothetical protein ANN_12550 [Periplaneta americana]